MKRPAIIGVLIALLVMSTTAVLGAKPVPPARNHLYIPPTISLSAYSLNNPLTITAKPHEWNFGDNRTGLVWAYNDFLPGPTLIASTGDNVSITLKNELAQETIIHWHGMVVNQTNDGALFNILTGDTYVYSFPIVQRAVLNFYHSHWHYAEQVHMGLAGAFIVRDAEEAALKLPSGTREVPLIVRDASFDKNGNLQYQHRSSGVLGNTPLVNGTLNPKLNVDSALYRFRVLNGANARVFRLVLGNGAPFTLIGNDGGLLAKSDTVWQIDMAPAERVDVLIDFRGQSVGNKIMLRDLRSGWDLLEFNVVGGLDKTGKIPTEPSTITSLLNPVQTRDFSFDGMTMINGKKFDGTLDFTVPFGETERWRFTSAGNAPHPVHVHGASFQVQSRTGGRGQVFPWEWGWKDTVLLENNETVEVLIRFNKVQHQGSFYLIHCHNLEHATNGMIQLFKVE